MKGTLIQVEDLFFNVSTRRNSLKNTQAEYRRILEMVTRYAIHYSEKGVGFTCKKHGGKLDVRTTAKASTLTTIGTVFGRKVTRELIPFTASTDTEIETDSVKQ